METFFDDAKYPEIEEMIEDCNEVMMCDDSPFDDIENEFIESVTAIFYSGEELTKSQVNDLKKTWDKI